MKYIITILLCLPLFAQSDLRGYINKIDSEILGVNSKNSVELKKKSVVIKEKPNKTNEKKAVKFPELKRAEKLLTEFKKVKNNTDKIKKTIIRNTKTLHKKQIKKSPVHKQSVKVKNVQKNIPFIYNTTNRTTLQMVLIGTEKIAVVDGQLLKKGDIIKNCKIINISINGITLKCKKELKSIKIGEEW